MQKCLLFCLFIGLWIFHTGCSSSQKFKRISRAISDSVRLNPIFDNHFTGFVLYDPGAGKVISDINGSRYFTPASNTKILTLYTALSVLPDPLPSFRYCRTGDSLYVRGMGDPSLLHPLWPDHEGLKLLKSAGSLVLVENGWNDPAFGAGWAWDDFADAYQAEKSAFPLYGNLARFSPSGKGRGYVAFPSYFQSRWVQAGPSGQARRSFIRRPYENEFILPPADTSSLQIPFTADPETIKKLLADTLHISVKSGWASPGLPWNIAYGVPADSVYARMMKVSDNFIAEQLILLCGAYLLDSLSTSAMIVYALDSIFKSVPQPLQWVDGSGLSRYNLFTPHSMVHVLDLIRRKISWDRITRIFPAGGVSGTLEKWYKGNQGPYVYAKTGSLMNNHSLSGYIRTRQGRILLFSFMHSNYTGSVNPIRREMQRLLEYVRDHY